MNQQAKPARGARNGFPLDPIVLRLAGVSLILRSDNAEWLTWVRNSWSHHAVRPDAAGDPFEIRYRLSTGQYRDFEPPSLDHGAAYRRSAAPGGFSIHAAHFRANVDLDRRQALVTGPLNLAPLYVLLHNLLPALIPDGLLIHGAGFARVGRAWVCAGPSGCGKSTLARLFPDSALADELVAVRRRGGVFVVEGLPFPTSRAAVVPLAGVHFLHHGDTHRRTRLAQPAALQALARTAFWPLYSQPAMRASLAVLAELAATVPCFDLTFLPDAGVWPLIASEPAAA